MMSSKLEDYPVSRTVRTGRVMVTEAHIVQWTGLTVVPKSAPASPGSDTCTAGTAHIDKPLRSAAADSGPIVNTTTSVPGFASA